MALPARQLLAAREAQAVESVVEGLVCSLEASAAAAQPSRHPERPARVSATLAHLEACGLVAQDATTLRVPARGATTEELLRAHTGAYVAKVSAHRGYSRHFGDEDSFACPATAREARMAAGTAVDVMATVASGRARNGAVIVRPPGHHACGSAGGGFCTFNNLAVGVRALQAAAQAAGRPRPRVMVVDWDVHHGNGTQQAFYSENSVLAKVAICASGVWGRGGIF